MSKYEIERGTSAMPLMVLAIFVIIFMIPRKHVPTDKELEMDSDINKNKYTTVGFLKSVGKQIGTYIYFYDDKKYTASTRASENPTISDEEKYFIVELSTRNPEFSRILLDREITDSKQISNAGFRVRTLKELMDNAMSRNSESDESK